MLNKQTSWLRLRRRILFASLTLIVIAAGVWFAYLIHCDREYNRIVAQIESWGGEVRTERLLPSGLSWLADQTGTHRLLKTLGKRVTMVDLSQTDIGDEELKTVAQLPGLYAVSANYTKISDDGLVALKSARELVVVHVVGTQVTDAGAAQLISLTNLVSIELDETLVSDESVRLLCSLPKLYGLGVSGPNVRAVVPESFQIDAPTTGDAHTIGQTFVVRGSFIVTDPKIQVTEVDVQGHS